MKFIYLKAATLMALIFTTFIPMAIAGPGHDHGDTTQQATGSALPRFTALSDELELVGIIDGKLVTVYLDRFKDNSPVSDARIEIDIAGSKYQAQKKSDGEYTFNLKDMLKPGVMAVTATIITGELSDLLATELDTHTVESVPSIRYAWKAIATWIGAGLLSLIALGTIVRFRQRARRA